MTYKVAVVDHPWEESLDVEHQIFENQDVNLIGNHSEPGQPPSEDEIIHMAYDADAIIHFDANITSKVIEKLKKCKVIVRQAVGYDNIDLKTARENRIYVANCPEYCTSEVATHAVSLLLASWRRLKTQDIAVHQNRWELPTEPLQRLPGSTLGLLAFGRIARAVAKKMSGFEVDIIAYDPIVTQEIADKYGATLVPLEELFKRSDMISCHAPLNQDTKGLVGEDLWTKAKQGVILVNTSRAEIFTEDALMEALRNEIIGQAGFDVWYREPIQEGEEILQFENVILTPHSAFFSEQAIIELRETCAQEVLRVFRGKPPKFWVNPW